MHRGACAPFLFDVSDGLRRVLTMIAPPVVIDPAAFGRVVLTSTISCWIEGDPQLVHFVGQCLRRYYQCDWGDTEYQEDRDSNDYTVKSGDGGRILAAYDIPADLPQPQYDSNIWIITEGFGCQALGRDCCYTTILFPGDY